MAERVNEAVFHETNHRGVTNIHVLICEGKLFLNFLITEDFSPLCSRLKSANVIPWI